MYQSNKAQIVADTKRKEAERKLARGLGPLFPLVDILHPSRLHKTIHENGKKLLEVSRKDFLQVINKDIASSSASRRWERFKCRLRELGFIVRLNRCDDGKCNILLDFDKCIDVISA